MANRARQLSRQLHLWITLGIFLPLIVVIGSGILLQVKKESDWVQPPTQKGIAKVPTLAFSEIIEVATAINELQVTSWDDVNKLDVRPDKGIVKILSENNWEAQIDAKTGDVLQVAYRRSDVIESIHDGSWFFEGAKLWIFLPVGILLLVVWISGLVLLYTTLKSKYRKKSYKSQ